MSLSLSLSLTNTISDKQIEWLALHHYYGTLNLTLDEASQLINELMEEERLERHNPEYLYFERINLINNQRGLEK